MLKVQSIGASFDPCLIPLEAVNPPTRSLWSTQYSCFVSHEWTRCLRSGFKSNKLSARTTRARLMASKAFSRSKETWMPPPQTFVSVVLLAQSFHSPAMIRDQQKGSLECLGWEGMQREAWF